MPEFDIVNIAMKFAFPAFVIIMIGEYFLAKQLFDLKESITGVIIALVAIGITYFTKDTTFAIFTGIFEWAKNFRMEWFGYESFGWSVGAWIGLVLLDDMMFYWHHRFSHSIRILWACHVPHHSAKKYNFTIGIRNGWFIPFFKPVWWLWLMFIGFEPIMLVTVTAINGIYQFTLHTQLMPSWGWIGRIINNPYQHRGHHACNTEYLDKNHGGIFLIWDRLFGTFVNVEDAIKIQYGVLHDPDSYNAIKVHTHEFEDIWKDVKSTDSWSEKFKYIFYPPGWSPDGSTLTSRQLQEKMNATS